MTKQCETCHRTYKTYRSKQKYCCVAHMPADVKRAGAIKGRAQGTRTFRLKRFRQDIRRLPQKLTREDLLEVFQQIYTRGYDTGYRTALWRQKQVGAKRERAA